MNTILKIAEHSIESTLDFDYRTLPLVLSYTHEDLIERMEKKLDLSNEEATLLFKDMHRFLAICGLLGPTKVVRLSRTHELT